MPFRCRKISLLKSGLHCAAYVLLLACITRAQYRFDNWATDDGLPQNSVLSITQTRDGYLWFTTFDGLVRFDGVRFTIFDKSNTRGISSNRFTTLFEDETGTLWIGSEYGGLTRYANGAFHTFGEVDGLSSNTVREIQQNERGELVISTDGGLFVRRGDEFEPNVEAGAPQTQVNYWGKSGAHWILDEKGLHQIKDNRAIDYPVFINRPGAAAFCEDKSGGLWFGTADANFYRVRDGVITEFSQNGRQVVRGAVKIEATSFAVHEDAQGNIWTSGPSLAILNPQTGDFQKFTVADNLPSNSIRSIFSDREGNVWLGTDGRGIIRASRKFISTYSAADGMKSENIYPIFEDSTGQVWIGGDILMSIKNGFVTNHDDFAGTRLGSADSFYEDRSGRLWIGFRSGIGYFQNDKFSDVSNITNHQAALVIKEDAAGNLWFGTDNGLIEFRNGKTTVYTSGDGLPNSEIKDIYEDASGTIWIATYGGFARFETGKFTAFTEQNGLVSNRVRTITGEADGTLWLGTYDGGLSRFKDGKFTNYTTAKGLFNNGVFRILEDSRGNFWMSSNRGIYSVAKQQLNDFADGKIQSINSIAYGKQDGMLSTECNGGRQPAGTKTRDGRLWFPTQQGVAVVDPEAVPFNSLAPPVLIEKVKIDNQEVDWRNAVDLQPGQSSVEIDYTGLSLIKSEQVHFKYKLEGLDADWTDAGTRRSAFYSYLPPGEYNFKVVAANSDGVWNTEGKSVGVRVVPPFYRTWWFYGLAIFSLVGFAFLIYRRRVSQLQKEKQAQQDLSRRLIESQEAERKRIAGELHDSLSQNLVIIKNRAMMSLSDRENTAYAFEQIEEIADAAGESLAEVREIAHNLRPFQIDRLGLTKAIEALARKANSPILRVEARLDKIDGTLSPQLEINLYRIVQESLNNIIKHSRATVAEVLIVRKENSVEITIGDNGKGFDVNSAETGEAGSESGFGLVGIAERARILGALLTVESKPDNGTKIFLRVSV